MNDSRRNRALQEHKYQLVLDVLTTVLLDYAVLLKYLPKCARCKTNCATIKHEYFAEHIICDECAARVIVKAKKNFTSDLSDPLNLIRGSLLREDDWHDLPEASAIRQLECDSNSEHISIFHAVH